MVYDTVDRSTVGQMVRAFYAAVIKDDIVGPYFTKVLGDDLSSDKWHDHFNTLDDFWLLLMKAEPGYMGDPFGPHLLIGELYAETFKRWLELFYRHVHKYFTPEIADKFYRKGEILADQFMRKLEIGQYEKKVTDTRLL